MNVYQLNKKQVVQLYKALKGSPLGFDYEKKTKESLIAMVLSKYATEQIQASIQRCFGDIPPVPTPNSENPPTVGAIPSLPPMPESATKSARQQALDVLLQEPTVNAEQLRQAVKEELAKQKPVIKHIVIKDRAEPKEVKGRVHKLFTEIVQRVSIGQNVMLIGPAGSGKTHVARQVADALSLPFGAISMSLGTTEADLFGKSLPQENGGFKYVDSVLTNMCPNPGLFLIDELDASDPNTLVKLNQFLEQREIFLPGRAHGQHLVMHKQFYIMACANTAGLGFDAVYSGRERLDLSTIDRFKANQLVMSYCDELEKELIDPEVLQWGLNIRKQIEKNKLGHIMSTRVMKNYTEQKINLGYGIKEFEKTYFTGWSKDERSKIV